MSRPLFQTFRDWNEAGEATVARRYGLIETSAGKFVAIHFRPWPKLLSWPEIWPVGRTYHVRGRADRCFLYYNQPLGHSRYLALKYLVSTAGTSAATVLAAMTMLDAVAERKRSDAILCDASNVRFSDRLACRYGWEAHKPQHWHRNYIKRFYGEYPELLLPLPARPAHTVEASAASMLAT